MNSQRVISRTICVEDEIYDYKVMPLAEADAVERMLESYGWKKREGSLS